MGKPLVRLTAGGAAWVVGGGAGERRALRKGLDMASEGYMLWSATERRPLITANRPSSSRKRAARGIHWILGYRCSSGSPTKRTQ